MGKHILIVGGAGFIGSHLTDELLQHGYRVRILDALGLQGHPGGGPPGYVNRNAELHTGDVRDENAVAKALQDIDAVVHLAAAVGIGQSMYEISRYTSVNNLGTAVLLDQLVRNPVEKLVVASSMSVYGEGTYVDIEGHVRRATPRTAFQLQRGNWEIEGEDGFPLKPVPTTERKPAEPGSVYALSKYDQERLCLMVGQAYQIPTVALRLFNVYGPRQALSNPYTGVMAVFASRYLNQLPPQLVEDGLQRRDFVHVRDVARALRLPIESPRAAGEVINAGSGRGVTLREVAHEMATALGCEHIAPEITNQHRVGDIRHCFADIRKARRLLGYMPQVSFEEGIAELAGWLEGQIAVNRSDQPRHERLQKDILV